MSQTISSRRLQGAAGVALFAGILVALNYLAGGVPARVDLTEDRMYSLSDATREILKGLPRDVTLKFYFTKSLEGPAGVQIKPFAQRIEDLLREYQLKSGGRVVLETYDPKPDSDEEEWAQRYGLTGRALDMLGGGPSLYLGLVAVCGAREAAIPFISPDQEPQLEYQVTRMIHEVTQEKKPKVAVLSSLPVMGMGGMPMDMMGMNRRSQPPWIAISQLQQLYDVVTMTPDAEEVPADTSVLLLIHPQNLGEKTQFAIDQFVLKGGRVLAFLDPQCITQSEMMGPQQMGMMMGSSSDLNALTKAWGVEMTAGKLAADYRNATRIRVSEDRAERIPAWLSLRKENVAADEVATGSLEFLMLPFAGSFTGNAADGLKLTTLVQTSDDAGEMDAMSFMMPDRGAGADFTKVHRALPLAVRLQGKFKTAFPAGRPKDPADTNAAPAAAAALSQAEKESAVVLVADADMLADRFCIETASFFGQEVAQVANDNINFLLNMVEQLTGSVKLVGLRSRGTFDRTFDRVLAMEEKAQAQWKEEEMKIQEKLRQTQQRLSELQSSKDAEQKMILSKEQKAEIEKFREDQFRFQQELKRVRKEFRRGIENLGLALKVINMAAVPLLVGLFGLWRGMSRRMG